MQVRVIREWDTVRYEGGSTPRVMRAVLYQAGDLRPRQVEVPKELATDATITAAIKADLEANPPQEPRTLQVDL